MATEQFDLDYDNLQFLKRRFKDDPIGFAEKILCRKWDAWQKKFIACKSRRQSRAAGHGVGKSWALGAKALHRLCTYEESQNLMTSVNWAQLTTRLYPTVVKLINGSCIATWFDISRETIKIKGVEENWIKFQPWNPSNSESFNGLHVKSPALFVDECSGVPQQVFDAWEGSMQHEYSMLAMIGNPLYRNGVLWDSANSKAHLFDFESISCIGSSYTSDTWIEEMKKTHGEDSDEFRTRVLGLFPTSETCGFVPEQLLRESSIRVIANPSGVKIGGLDVAHSEYGDESVFTVRQGNKMLLIKYWRIADGIDLAYAVAEEIKGMGLAKLIVDANGVGGVVYDALKRILGDLVMPLPSLNKKDVHRQFADRRTMYWGLAREALRYSQILPDEKLIRAGASLLKSYDLDGKEKLESKDLARKRGIGSPDPFDSWAYTYAYIPEEQPVETVTYKSNDIRPQNVSLAWM